MYTHCLGNLPKGTSGIGEAVEEGVEKHKEIHHDMSEYQEP